MPRNVEWKGKLPDLWEAAARAAALGAELHSVERQSDTYFRVPQGRLKLRRRWVPDHVPAAAIVPAGAGESFDRELPPELIAYRRPDHPGARASDYVRVCLEEGSDVVALFEAAVGVDVEVEKTRHVFVHDRVRIHLDDVKECGTFLELEAIVDERCDDERASAKIRRLLAHFGLALEASIPGSYRELVRGG
jgi:adenylate cyclase class IV